MYVDVWRVCVWVDWWWRVCILVDDVVVDDIVVDVVVDVVCYVPEVTTDAHPFPNRLFVTVTNTYLIEQTLKKTLFIPATVVGFTAKRLSVCCIYTWMGWNELQ